MITAFKRRPMAGWVPFILGSLSFSPAVFAEDQHWVQRINMSGLIEAEYSSGEGFDGSKSSDIAVATVEVHLDAKVNDKVDAHVVLLHEEDETDFSVDAAFLDVALGGATVSVGAMGAPFGAFATYMLDDPLTMQIAETAETILQVGTEIGPVHVAAYMFNGSTQEAGGDDAADQIGAHLAYVKEGEGFNMDIGVDYISNIADSDTIGDYLDIAVGGVVQSYVPAQIFHANMGFGSLHVVFEHLVTDKFDVSEIAFNAKGAEITATNIELAYDLTIAGMESTVGVAMQSTEEALALGMPKERTMAAISFGVAKYTALTFEYANSTDYDVADGGTGKDANSFTLQLAVGF